LHIKAAYLMVDSVYILDNKRSIHYVNSIVNKCQYYDVTSMAKYHSEEQRNLKKFFDERPSISKQGFANEAGISRQYLNYILNGQRRFTKATKKKMRPVLFKYGCQHPVAFEDFNGLHKCPACDQLTKERIMGLSLK